MMKTSTDRRARLLPTWASLALSVSLLALSLVLLVGLVYAQSGSISGTVTYYGGLESGTFHLNVYYTTDPNQPPGGGIDLSGSGDYTLAGLPDGTYYVCISIDPGDGGGPYTCYDPNGDGMADPVEVSGGGAVTGIDISLGGPWLPLGGPAVEGGQVTALAVHPAISGTVYAAVQSRNADWFVPTTIYETSDGAASWTAIYTAPRLVTTLAAAGSVIYAGDYNRDGVNALPLIHYSGDGGMSWSDALPVQDGTIWDVDIHPSLPQTAIAGGGHYEDRAFLYKTTDGGVTWTEVFSYSLPGGYATVNAVLIHPTDPLTCLLTHDGAVGATWGSYIWRSTDGGDHWTEVYSLAEDGFGNFVVDPVTPTLVYVSTWQHNFYRSEDGGATWEAIITDGSAGWPLVVDPSDNTLYALSEDQVRRSTDRGETWTTAGNAPEWVEPLAIDLGPAPGTLYAGGSEGVYRSTNQGQDWEQRNNGIETLVLPVDIDVDPHNLDKILVAAEGSGGWMTDDGGQTWDQILEFNMNTYAINLEDPEIVYSGRRDNDAATVARSDDGGLSFTPVYTPPFFLPGGAGGEESIETIVIAPSRADTVYAAGRDNPNWADDRAVVVRSLDDGVSWTEVFTLPPPSEVKALVVHPADDDIVFAGGEDCSGPDCEGFVYRTTDGGDSWDLTLVTTNTVESIVIDHLQPDAVYVADNGYWVLKSEDGGDNWTVVRPPWSVSSGNRLAIDPNVSGHVYLGGFGYIAETVDGGATWSNWEDPLNQSTPRMEPSVLVADGGTVTQTLYAGFTGVWAHSRPALQRNRVYLPVVIRAFAP
jgi:photosystem II stability/assembly factor-like uncharacterized protein